MTTMRSLTSTMPTAGRCLQSGLVNDQASRLLTFTPVVLPTRNSPRPPTLRLLIEVRGSELTRQFVTLNRVPPPLPPSRIVSCSGSTDFISITHLEDLNDIRNNPDGDYCLTRDLDFEDDDSYRDLANKELWTVRDFFQPSLSSRH